MAAQERLSQSALAERLGLDPRQVRNLTKRGLPRRKDGSYPWAQCRDWYIEFKLAAERRPGDEVERDLDRREQLAKIHLAELKLRQAQGQLVTTTRYRRRIAALAQEFAAVIRSLPMHAPDCVGLHDLPEATTVLEKIANALLAQARGEDDAAIPDPEPEEDDAQPELDLAAPDEDEASEDETE